MKKFSLALVLIGLLLTACGTDSATKVDLELGLIPQDAVLVGVANIPEIYKIDLVKDNLPKDLAQLEEVLGFKATDLGPVIFWGKDEENFCLITSGIKIDAFKDGTSLNYRGKEIFSMDKSSAVSSLDEKVLIGSPDGVKASIDAALDQKGGSEYFNELLSKTRGLVNLAFVPDAKLKDEFVSNFDSMDELSDLIESFSGLAFGVNYASKKLEIRLAVASDENASKQASKMLTELKSEAKDQVEGIGMLLGKEIASELKKALDSFKAKVDGKFLKLDLDISEALITGAVSQLGGFLGESLMDKFED